MDLIRLLRLWLPPSLTGSISTLPIAYGRYMCRDDLGVVRKNLLTVLRELELSASAGKPVILALEPERGACWKLRGTWPTSWKRWPFLPICVG